MTKPEARLLAFLRSVETGDTLLSRPEGVPEWEYILPIRYRAANGWEIEVIYEDGEWSHIHEIVFNGLKLDYEHLMEEAPSLLHYRPSDEVLRDYYHYDYVRSLHPQHC